MTKVAQGFKQSQHFRWEYYPNEESRELIVSISRDEEPIFSNQIGRWTVVTFYLDKELLSFRYYGSSFSWEVITFRCISLEWADAMVNDHLLANPKFRLFPANILPTQKFNKEA